MKEMEDINKYILIDNFFNVFIDTKYEKEDEDVFGDDSIDVDQIVNKNIKLFRQLRTQSMAELNNAKHQRVLDFLSKLRDGIKSNVEEYKKIADAIITQSKLSELQPMFRNYDDVSEKDKESILLDAELLNMLSDIEEEYNTKD